MPPPDITHYVFVDFENVPKVDLSLIKGHAAHVTLLIGKKQTKIETTLSVQLNVFADQVSPVQVDASGRNALDMILAGYLGRAVERHPGARFYVVSKDKDFVPLLDHLRAQGIHVSRHDAFAALPFLASPRRATTKPPFGTTATALAPTKSVAPSKAQPSPKPKAVAKMAKFIAHLRNSPPSNRTRLEHTITAFFKPSLPTGGMKGVIAELTNRGAVVIDTAGKVTCPPA